MKSSKHGLSPEKIEQRFLAGERAIFNMHRLEKTQKLHRRMLMTSEGILQRKRN